MALWLSNTDSRSRPAISVTDLSLSVGSVVLG